MEALNAVLDVSSPWIYVSFFWMIFSLIVWKIAMHEFKQGTDNVGKGILMSIYVIISILDKIIFVQVVIKQPSFDFGYYGSVVVPTILFYLFLVLTILIGIRALSFGFLTPMSLLQNAPGMYGMALIQFSYAMGYSSPAGMLLAFVSFITAGWKAIAVPVDFLERKVKED